MHTGFYTATMGMLVDQAMIDNISNNLANINSTGYKADSMSFESTMRRKIYRTSMGHKDAFLGSTTNAVVVDRVTPNMAEGSLEKTGGPTDFAIKGTGFFAIKDGEKIAYTRNGSFTLSSKGYLVDKKGREVLNAALKPIFFKSGVRPAVFDVENSSYLEKVGNTCFMPTPKSGQFVLKPDSKVLKGYLESSNVNAIKEMVNMISAYRHYEIAQRVVTTEDTLFSNAINVGRAR